MRKTQSTKSIDFLLAQTCRMHYARVHERLETIGLYRGQPPMMHALWEQEGLTHAELAARLQVSPVTVTKMIQRLEKAGFVQRGSDPQDQRFSRVYLTKAGRAIHLEANAVLAHIEAETFAGFSNEEIETLRGYFQKIQTNLGKDTSAA